MKKTLAVLAVAALLASACGEKPPEVKPVTPAQAPPPPPPPVKPSAPVARLAPPLTDAQKAALAKDFTDARALAKEGEKLKLQAEEIEKAQGRQAANDTFVQAKEKFHKACEAVSDWLEGDLAGKVTDAQVKDYLSSYGTEVQKWQKALSDIGKVHKD